MVHTHFFSFIEKNMLEQKHACATQIQVYSLPFQERGRITVHQLRGRQDAFHTLIDCSDHVVLHGQCQECEAPVAQKPEKGNEQQEMQEGDLARIRISTSTWQFPAIGLCRESPSFNSLHEQEASKCSCRAQEGPD